MDLPKRVRIVSDGTGSGTSVLDERGDPISKRFAISAIRWSIKPRDIARAEIDMCLMGGDLDGEAHYFALVEGRRLEIDCIRFKDGTEWVAKGPAVPNAT